MEIQNSIFLICLFYLHFIFVEGNAKANLHRENGRKAGKKICYVGIPQRTNKLCQSTRAKELAKNRLFYKITGPENALPHPHLDQPARTAFGYFAKEKFHSRWSYLFMTLARTSLLKTMRSMTAKYAKTKFTCYGNYTKLTREFEDSFLKALHHNKHFKYTSRSYQYFTNLMKDERFLDDEYFVQMRSVGGNPMVLRRVTLQGKRGTKYCDLKKRLNPNFDWNYEVTSITGDMDIEESIEDGKVYVADYSVLEGIQQMPDFLAKYNPSMKMRNNPAQIAIFAVDNKRKLRIVAIQKGTTQAGPVYTPRDGLLWSISKKEFGISDTFYRAVIEHLLKTHYKMEPICLSMKRHLSKLHPLHQILQYHCRGLIPANVFSIVALIKATFTLRSLFSHGNKGAVQLLLKEYPKMVWNDNDLEVSLKERGMDDKRKLPCYPYRDDGRLVNSVLRKFANKLIKLFYKHDSQVRRDFELQNMIGELTQRRGAKHANRISKVKGLPSRFRTRKQLSNFVRQVLWLVVQHSAVGFPAADYFTPPLVPSKLYESRTNGINLDFVQMMPGPVNTITQAATGSGAGTLHFDSMFDYWKKLKSRKLKYIVKKAYKDLAMVQHRINMRNKRRYQRGQITNPYMMRDWMPNSIST